MERQRHKRKKHRFVLLASDAVNAGVEQIHYHPWGPWIVILVLCAFLGACLGYFYVTEGLRTERDRESSERQAQIAQLEQEKSELEAQIESLNETIQILSNTVNQKTQNENQLSEQLEKQKMPTEFPLTGAVTMEDTAPEGDPMCIFIATDGAMVVATAGGTVTAVNDDSEFGHNIWVDHGNGYVTVYRNSGEIKVKQGEIVTQGTTLFLISEENSRLGYQMMRDGTYIDPMEMLAISG